MATRSKHRRNIPLIVYCSRTDNTKRVAEAMAGSLAADVTAALADRPSRLANLGVPREEFRRYGSPAEHDAAFGLDPAGIRAQLDSFLGY